MSDHISALAALYQGEKTDAAYIFNTAIALMGLGTAYVAAMVVAAPSFGGAQLGWSVVLWLPSPLWIIAAFHSLITLNAMGHGVSVRVIENALFEESRLQVDRDLVGSASGDKIMDITLAKPAHQMATLVVYVGVLMLVLGFTVFAVFRAWASVGLALRLAAVSLYALLAATVAWSWRRGLQTVNDAGRRAQAPPRRDHGEETETMSFSHEGDARQGAPQSNHAGAVLDVHLNEYQALTTRATYYIVLNSAVWPLMFALFGLLVTSLAYFTADNRREYAFPILVWAGGFGAQLALVIWTFLVSEQYKIVLYIEKYLRPLVRDQVGTSDFWLYEALLRKRRRGWPSRWLELQTELTVLVLLLAVISARVLVFRKFTPVDWAGLAANIVILVILCMQAATAARIRHQWEAATPAIRR